MSTLTTGEYGDKAKPSGVFKRLMVIAWMVLSVIFVAQFTASITSDLTVQQLTQNISGLADLPGKSVAMVPGSTAADYLRRERIAFQEVERIEIAYGLLERGRIQTIVYDTPALAYYAVNQGRSKAQVVGPVFREEAYSIVLQSAVPCASRLTPRCFSSGKMAPTNPSTGSGSASRTEHAPPARPSASGSPPRRSTSLCS